MYLEKYFDIYPANKAPFMHKQFAQWKKTRPLEGLKVLHHVPLVPNTLLKIACLVIAGAEVVVSNPSFISPDPIAIAALKKAGISYVEKIEQLKDESFDLYFDCGAELYRTLSFPRLGAVELTATGDQFYRKSILKIPVINIDASLTKQMETLFGCVESAPRAIAQLTGCDVAKKTWLIFGFGKVGRGVAYYCVKNNVNFMIADTESQARSFAESFGIKTLDSNNKSILQNALMQAEIIVTATGKKGFLSQYPKAWFQKKILANMGAEDEYGDQFHQDEVLNHKKPVNFVLDEPTSIEYIDPTFYAHNIAALELLNNDLPSKVFHLSKTIDEKIVQQWCRYHNKSLNEFKRWCGIT